jgi:ribonuclease P/MRP protein subunit POP3
VNLQNTALACTLSLLDGVSDYQSARGQENRKRKQLQKDARPNKKKKIDVNAPTGDPDVVLPDVSAPSEETDPPALPAALSHLLIGLNAVTKRLDAQIRSLRKTVSLNPDPTSESVTPIKVIVVCRADVDPQILIDHLPHEVAAFNSSKPDDPIKLIPLPKGAEATLAKAVGLRRVAVIAMDVRVKFSCPALAIMRRIQINMPGLAAFTSILESVPTVTAPWLTSLAASAAPVELIPTHVKQLRTTAPKDMKMAKRLRAEGKAAAKARKKSKPKRTGKNAATPTAL